MWEGGGCGKRAGVRAREAPPTAAAAPAGDSRSHSGMAARYDRGTGPRFSFGIAALRRSCSLCGAWNMSLPWRAGEALTCAQTTHRQR